MTVIAQSKSTVKSAGKEGSTQDRHRPTTRAWVIVGLLVFFQIIAFADKAVLGLVAPQAMPDLGLTPTQFGFIGSAFFFLYAIVSVITGILASKFSVRWIILTLGVVWAVMQFPMLLGGGAAVLLATRIILGGAEGPATAMSLTSVNTWFHPSRRALPSNLVAVGSTLGPVFAAPFIAWVIGTWGWRWAFGALGIVGLVWITVWLLFGGDGPYRGGGAKTVASREDAASPTTPTRAGTEDDAGAVDQQEPVNIWYALLSITFLAALLAAASNFWVQGFLTTWLPQYLTTVVGLSLAEVGAYTTFPWVFGALVLLVLGWLGQRLLKQGRSAHVAIAIPFGMSTAVAGMAFLLVPVTPAGLAVPLLTIAGGCSLVFPMAAAAIGYAVGSKQRPIMMATLGGFAAFGAIISPILVGSMMSNAGYETPAKGTEPTAMMIASMADGVHSAFLITGVFLVVAGLLAALLLRPERLGRRLQERRGKANV